MTACRHHQLVLLPDTGNRLRCRHCHLTITSEELGDGYCPECYEIYGRKQYDFETVADGNPGITRYRCEECGAIIVLGEETT